VSVEEVIEKGDVQVMNITPDSLNLSTSKVSRASEEVSDLQWNKLGEE